MPSGLISTSSNGMGWRSTSAASLEKGSELRPWNERVQSTWWLLLLLMSRSAGLSSSPVLAMFWIGWGAGAGVGAGEVFDTDGGGLEGVGGAAFGAGVVGVCLYDIELVMERVAVENMKLLGFDLEEIDKYGFRTPLKHGLRQFKAQLGRLDAKDAILENCDADIG